MTAPLKAFYSVDTVREIDRLAIEDCGVPGYTLMTRAGEAATTCLLQWQPQGRSAEVLCGAGNNGGDGYVVARLLRDSGWQVTVSTVIATDKLQGDAARAFDDWSQAGGETRPWAAQLYRADVYVDALLGSGLDRPVTGVFADAIRALNAMEAPVLALDLPSGLNGDTGEIMGVAVNADVTTTFVGRKAGAWLGQGPNVCGDVHFFDLDIDSSCYDGLPVVMQGIEPFDAEHQLPSRQTTANKGDLGHVLVVGGGPGMAGAAKLCGEAALRAGAGRVSVATHPDNATAMLAACPELMVHPVSNGDDLAAQLADKTVIAFGPGLGTEDWAQSLYATLANSALPAVWDADALNLLAGAPTSMPTRIITPHPGEAGRLLDLSAQDVQTDRLYALKALDSQFGGVTVLKGAGTLVTQPAEPPRICLAGNPGMATAGMGDVLTGVIAGLLAQGLDLDAAARLGVQLHAQAGDVAAQDGERGLIASDVIAAVRQQVQ